ncbi:MAG: hypothetical protein KGJ37_07285 [Verrucomicrobiota bacterium]|nr:hypothetical protein [Verrucomicrobiota bacterium]
MSKQFKFKPAKRVDGPGSPGNGERAERAFRTVLVYHQHLGESFHKDDPTGIQDLISDVAHLCDEYNHDFDDVCRMARDRWREER